MSVAIAVFWNVKKYCLEERYLCLRRMHSTLKIEAAGLSETLMAFYDPLATYSKGHLYFRPSKLWRSVIIEIFILQASSSSHYFLPHTGILT